MIDTSPLPLVPWSQAHVDIGSRAQLAMAECVTSLVQRLGHAQGITLIVSPDGSHRVEPRSAYLQELATQGCDPALLRAVQETDPRECLLLVYAPSGVALMTVDVDATLAALPAFAPSGAS